MNQNQPSQNISMEQIKAFASSPAGKQLIALMQHKGGMELSNAQSYAASGNMEKAKESLSALLSDPQIQALIKRFGG